MSGHSKWATIKRKKGALDQKRGKIFSRLAKEVQVAARMGGGDPGLNPRLRQAIAAAKAESMPSDNITNAIKKGTGEIEGGPIEEILYEGYGPGGVALLIESATDNKNRSAAEIRSIFTKSGGNLAAPNAVAWMFKRRGLLTVPADATTEDDILAAALDAGLEDVKLAEDVYEVITPDDRLMEVHDALKAAGIEPSETRLTYIPENLTEVTDPGVARQVLTLLDKLDDQDDVQNVHSNFDMDPDLIGD